MNGSRDCRCRTWWWRLDDADGRMLYARFFAQEGTASTFAALEGVVRRYGRFCELYTDRGSHFCTTREAGAGPDAEQNGQVSQALRALGIGQILARSPQARGRSERAFGTLQGRLPQELRLNRITNYADANRYLEEHFVADFNRRFTVQPAQPESAFTKLPGIELDLVLSAKHQRIVRNDNTVVFHNLILQLPATRQRIHFVRCPVTVHQFSNAPWASVIRAVCWHATTQVAACSPPAPIRCARRQCATAGPAKKCRPSRCYAPDGANPKSNFRPHSQAEERGRKNVSNMQPQNPSFRS